MLPSSRPQPSRSFRPTRLLAALTCLTSSPSPVFSPFPPSLSSTAGTQSVIPAHSVLDVLSSSFSSLLSPLAFPTALTQSVIPAHSVFGFLPLAHLLPIIFTFLHSLDSVGHSGPLGLWLLCSRLHFSLPGFWVFPLPP